MDWILKAYGIRGSYPVTAPAYQYYGGNTSCYYLNCGEHLIFDAGTGIIKLGQEICEGPIHLLLGHFHQDHIQGLPLFGPLFEKGREIHIYGERYGDCDCRKILQNYLRPPYWPIALDGPEIRAEIHYHTLTEDVSFTIGSITVTPVRLQHPNGCLGFVVRNNRICVSYLLDCELNKMNTDRLKTAITGSSAAIMDGSYLPDEIQPGFGHSSWKECLSLGEACGIRQIILSHFGDRMTDSMIDAQKSQASDSCIFAKEGMEWIISD